jgi:peptidoglycan hydrolase CwlO-like protein
VRRGSSQFAPWRLARLRAFSKIGLAVVLASAVLVWPTAHAQASVSSDGAQISQLENEIRAQGQHVKDLVGRYNDAQQRVDALNLQITESEHALAADQQVEFKSMILMHRSDVEAYVGSTGTPAPLVVFGDASSITSVFEQNRYLGEVARKMNAALDAVNADQQQTRADEKVLQSQRDQAQSNLHDLANARDAVQGAIATDEATLGHVKGNLQVLLAAAAQQQRAEQLATERTLATAPVVINPPAVIDPPNAPASLPPPSVAPAPTSSPSPSHSGYANPLRDVRGLVPERIDQGVDYAGFGPVYPLGDGVVLSTSVGGWPGGTFISYRLTDGPAQGLAAYVAEDIAPAVQVGDAVTPSTVLGQVYGGPDGIETGWADPSAIPNTMARSYGQFGGSNSSAFGYNFSQLLQSLGAPGGILQGGPSGSLPAGWPQW